MPDYVLNLVLDIVTPLLAVLLLWGSGELIRLVRQNVKNERLRSALERATHLVEVSVAEVEQRFVGSLKEQAADGKLTDYEASIALKNALDTVKSHLGPRGIAELREVIGDGTEESLVAYLVSLIEAQIAKSKE